MVTKHQPKLKEIPSNKSTDLYHESLQQFFNGSIITKDVATILFPFDKNDKPCFILIEGPPGIGKSLLLKEIAYRWGKNEILTKDVSVSPSCVPSLSCFAVCKIHR